MRVAYLILAHKNPSQLERLIRTLYADAFRPSFFIHIDKKVPNSLWKEFNSVLRNLPDVKIELVKRENSAWGSLGMVLATLNGLRCIVESTIRHDYIILLSGLDYPLKSNAYIHHFLAENYGKNFLQFKPLTETAMPDRMVRIRAYHFKLLGKFFCYPSYASTVKRKLLDLILLLPLRFPKERQFPPYLHPYTGSQWWCITHKAAEYIMDFLKIHPDYVAYHQHSFIPDEMFFQSILLSAQREELTGSFVNNNLRFVDWRVPYPRPANYIYQGPTVFTHQDFALLMNSDKLFARKFDVTQDEKILDRLDEALTA